MTAVLGTVPFVATLWLLAVVAREMAQDSGIKVRAALKREPLLPVREHRIETRVRTRWAGQRLSRASGQARAAA